MFNHFDPPPIVQKRVTFEESTTQAISTNPAGKLQETATSHITRQAIDFFEGLRSETSSSEDTENLKPDGLLNFAKWAENASGAQHEIHERKNTLAKLDRPLERLQNNRKLRGGEGGLFADKKRSFISIKSRIGGAKSQAAVGNILKQLDKASKLPNDPNNQQPITNHLDQLLDNEWFSKTIAHDDSGALKNLFLEILANEMVTKNKVEADLIANPILAKLNPKTPMAEKQQELNAKLSPKTSMNEKQQELNAKLSPKSSVSKPNEELNPKIHENEKAVGLEPKIESLGGERLDGRGETIKNQLALMQKKPTMNTVRELGELCKNEIFINTLNADPTGELKKPIFEILTNLIVNNYTIQASDVNSILGKLTEDDLGTPSDKFENALMDMADYSARIHKCDNSDIFIESWNNVLPTIYSGEVQGKFLTEYPKLLNLTRSRDNFNANSRISVEQNSIEDSDSISDTLDPFKNIFGAQYAESHEEAMESLKKHDYVVEKSGDKFIYHFDLIGIGVRSKELSREDAEKGPEFLKGRLDTFVNKVSDKLNPK